MKEPKDKTESMTLAAEPCPDCGSTHHRSCNAQTREPLTAEQLRIDLSNLKFYAAMFIEHGWQTPQLALYVFNQTLIEIAERIEHAAHTTAALRAERDQANERAERAIEVVLRETKRAEQAERERDRLGTEIDRLTDAWQKTEAEREELWNAMFRPYYSRSNSAGRCACCEHHVPPGKIQESKYHHHECSLWLLLEARAALAAGEPKGSEPSGVARK